MERISAEKLKKYRSSDEPYPAEFTVEWMGRTIEMKSIGERMEVVPGDNPSMKPRMRKIGGKHPYLYSMWEGFTCYGFGVTLADASDLIEKLWKEEENTKAYEKLLKK